MSTPQNKPGPWKAVAIGFIILTALFGAVGAVAVYEMTVLSNDKNALQTNYNTLKTADDANLAKIDSLNNNINSLNNQITTLQAQNATNQATIASLKAQLAGNVSALEALETPFVAFKAFWTITPSSCTFFCLFKTDGSGTVNAVAFANLGTTSVHNVQLTVTFVDAGKSPLCSVVLTLAATLDGRTVSGLTPEKSCDTGPYPISATDATALVTWT